MKPTDETIQDFLNTMPAVLYEYVQYESGGGDLLYMSPTSREILGYPPQHFADNLELFWQMIHPDDRDRLRNEDDASIHDPSFTSDARILHPSGEVRWLRFKSKPSPIQKRESAVVWTGCIIDITMQKLAEEEARVLRGVLPICQHCKRIRPLDRAQSDPRPWIQIEEYIHDHSGANFSHGICPDCMRERYSGGLDSGSTDA